MSLGVNGAFEAEAGVHKVGGVIGPVGTIGRRVMIPAAVAPTIEAARAAVARVGVEVPQGPRKVAAVAGESTKEVTSCIHYRSGARWAHHR